MIENKDLLTPSELAQLIEHDQSQQLRIVDASWYFPIAFNCPGRGNIVKNGLKDYQKQRISEAVFFDHDIIVNLNNPLPQACPTAERFAECVGQLGININSHVVIYEDCGYFSAPRCWFMFKLFGHRGPVQILEGGLPRWIEAGYHVEKCPPPEPVHPPCVYEGAQEQTEMQMEVSELLENLDRAQVIDCRNSINYQGEAKDHMFKYVNSKIVQFESHRTGRIPGAKNVPYPSIIQEDGTLLPTDRLAQVFAQAGVDLDRPSVVVCSGGCTASILLLAMKQMGIPPEKRRLLKDGMGMWSTTAAGSYPMVGESNC